MPLIVESQDPFSYDPATPTGQVRLLLNDVDPERPVFSDDEITAFLTLESNNVKRAAAQAIDTNATNEALASKVLRSQDLSTNGAQVAEAMRKHADRLRAQADAEAEETDDGFYFGIVDIAGDPTVPEHTAGY